MTNDEYQALPQEQRAGLIELHNRHRWLYAFDDFIGKSEVSTQIPAAVEIQIDSTFYLVDRSGKVYG